MSPDPSPESAPPQPVKDVVLVGGGHAHVFVLKAFGETPDPGVRLTLIAKELDAPYSGMLPGMVAGHYTPEQCHIDLRRLSHFAGARLIHGAATRIDRAKREIMIDGHPPVPYDVASFDVGITPDLSSIEGAEAHALAVKPVSRFAAKWDALLHDLTAKGSSREGRIPLLVVGGGAAGFELALAINHRLREAFEAGGASPAITLVAGARLLPGHNSRARKLAVAELKRAGIELREDAYVASLSDTAATLKSGETLACVAAVVATGARAPAWLTETSLPLDAGGYIQTRTTLQIADDDDIFAVGDCATIADHPRPKSGVFAVRQGPVLVRNLRAHLAGKPLENHIPQKEFLTLLSLGRPSAIAARGSLAASGGWAWVWKDWIDRGFMKQFNEVPRADEATGTPSAVTG